MRQTGQLVTAATATSITAIGPAGATLAPIILLHTGTVLAAYSLTNFNPIYSPAKTSIAASDFLAKLDFTTGNTPVAGAIGDLDGNGKPDLAVANCLSNNISVLRNADIAAAALPVALLDFNAQLNTNGTVQLNWLTATEINSSYFEVVRSTDGVNSTTLGKITAVGNSTQVRRYHFIDRSPLSGINYYKLLQYDLDGKKTDLGIRAVKISLTTNYLMVYPNPGKDAVRLRFEANIYQQLALVDITGKILITRAVGKQH